MSRTPPPSPPPGAGVLPALAMTIPIAREGWGLVAALGGGAVLARLIGRSLRPVAYLLGAGAGFAAVFFRDPERVTTRAAGGVVAPADGRVVDVSEVEAPEYLGGPVRKVSIFMSLLDCHVNRAPVSGTVEYRSESAGGYAFAFRPEAEENRRTSLGIAGTPSVLMRQVAGWVARQIVTRPLVGDAVEQGERIGMIRFGSRVDVFFPLDRRLRVRPGDTVIGGVTVIAEPPEKR